MASHPVIFTSFTNFADHDFTLYDNVQLVWTFFGRRYLCCALLSRFLFCYRFGRVAARATEIGLAASQTYLVKLHLYGLPRLHLNADLHTFSTLVVDVQGSQRREPRPVRLSAA